MECQVLERDEMAALGMHSLLSVAQGSHQPPKLIVLQYKGGKSDGKPVVLVGKGDHLRYRRHFAQTGARNGRDEVRHVRRRQRTRHHQGGSAAEAAAQPDGDRAEPREHAWRRRQRPGDIVTSMSGQTIEILNTDAEGRLILCDALTYAARFDPDTVIDVATLTGACVIALGHVATGLFANNDDAGPRARKGR
jgi:leucyl aminopeptidase